MVRLTPGKTSSLLIQARYPKFIDSIIPYCCQASDRVFGLDSLPLLFYDTFSEQTGAPYKNGADREAG
jgi:hypothetical protein